MTNSGLRASLKPSSSLGEIVAVAEYYRQLPPRPLPEQEAAFEDWIRERADALLAKRKKGKKNTKKWEDWREAFASRMTKFGGCVERWASWALKGLGKVFGWALRGVGEGLLWLLSKAGEGALRLLEIIGTCCLNSCESVAEKGLKSLKRWGRSRRANEA